MVAKKRKQARSKARGPSTAQRAFVDAQLERQLDAIDQALLRGEGPPEESLVEPLVQHRARSVEVLTRRLAEGRARVPMVALELIAGFALDKAETQFKRIARNEGVPDDVRLAAQRRAGWPEEDVEQRRLAFLGTLKDGEAALVESVRLAGAGWPPEVESLEETCDYLAAMPAARRRSLVERLIAELDEHAAWLMRGALALDDSAAQRLAIEALVRFKAEGARGALERLAQTTSDAELRAEAEAAARRLALRPVDDHAARELPEFERAFLSTIDADGGQIILVLRRAIVEAAIMVNVFFDERSGLKNAYGSTHYIGDSVEEIKQDFEEQGIDLLEVDLATARGAVALGLETSVSLGRRLTPALELWEPLLHDADPPPEDEALTLPILDDRLYVLRNELVEGSGQLLEDAFFDTWTLDPISTITAMVGVPPPGRRGWTDRQYRGLIDRLVDLPTRARLRRVLRRQAWLLERDDSPELRDIALATAAHLGHASPEDLARTPFLRELLIRTVASALALVLDPSGLDDEED